MKDFTYEENHLSGLHVDACEWLKDMGLKETRWILDSEWLLSFINNITYEKWIREEK